MDIRILGLGNVLMSDDGFGPYVARVLDAFYELPDEVQAIDAGTPGLDLTPYLLGADEVIFIDTVKSEGAPGDIRTYTMQDILRHLPQPRLSPHDPGLKEALLTVAAHGGGPRDARLIGVIPEWVATGVQLSPCVRSAIAPVVGLIVMELERLGLRPRLRPVPRRPDTWWERAAPRAASVLQVRRNAFPLPVFRHRHRGPA
jgi:hydrogenase maturation protease